MKNTKKLFSVLIFVCISLIPHHISAKSLWDFQSIDTMKYSRDKAREKLDNPTFDAIIDQQVNEIAKTGATHIGIATPYDEEFLPFLKRWVATARKYNLHVWFRGNWSGWEGWFKYPRITRETHLEMTEQFILSHQDLFEDGDVFSACPECENGGPGDPRHTGDIQGHRDFLIQEYKITKAAFKKINKNVASNYLSMNGDVALATMDKPTTKALDGIVAVDHYVETPEKLSADLTQLAISSGGKIILGEFGAPIPDIHGEFTQQEQQDWLEKALSLLMNNNNVIGMNYWSNIDSSTALWEPDSTPRKAVTTLTKFYTPKVLTGQIINSLGKSVPFAKLYVGNKLFIANDTGKFEITYIENTTKVDIKADGYFDKSINIPTTEQADITIELIKQKKNLLYKLHEKLISLIDYFTNN